MVEKEQEDFGIIDQMAINARIELEVQYRLLKEEIKIMNNDNCRYLKKLMSIFECESGQEMKG